MKTFLLFVLTLTANAGEIIDARPVSDTLMTAEECVVAQAGRASATKDGKVQVYQCRNTAKPGELTRVAEQTPVDVQPRTRVLGALVLKVCGKPIAVQLQIITENGPALLTRPLSVLLPADLEKELAAVESYKAAGGLVYSIELKPGCVEV